jgi:hypothetical protein
MRYFVTIISKNMNKNNCLIFFSFLLLTGFVSAQEETKNIQDYTPSVLINKRETEFKLFNNLYTQTHFFDQEGARQDEGNRSTFFTSIAEFNYGVSSKFTLGGEIWFKSVKNDITTSSPIGVLDFTNSESSRSGLSLIGFKIKFNPIKKWEKLSVQSSLLANVLSDPDGSKFNQPYLDANRHLWITKAFYDKSFGTKFQLFIQLSTWVSVDTQLASENTNMAAPIDVFASYFATKKLTFYIQNQFWPSLGDEGLSSYFVQEGLGVKYQIFPGVEIEGLYTQFIIGESTGAGQTFNFGIRFLN